MLRFVLPILIGVLIIVAASVVIFANVFGIKDNIPFLASKPAASQSSYAASTATPKPVAQASTASAVINAQSVDSGASGQVAQISVSGTDVSNATLLTQIQQLQSTLNQLSARVTALEKKSATTTKTTYVQTTTPAASSNSSANAPIYIPLGTGGSSTGLDWTSIPTQSIVINTAQYSGYTSMTLQVNLQVYQGNGTAYAQLYNTTTGTAVISSLVSTTSSSYTQLSSGNFTITPGQNTYVLQLKSSTGYAAMAGNASIVVAF